MRWHAMTRTAEDRYGFEHERLVAQVARYEVDGGFWAAFARGERVPGRYATRDAAERAAESALGEAVGGGGDDLPMSEWIPIDGRDAGAAYPTYVNPAVVATASFWTDQAGKRVVTLELTTGRTVELREPKALELVGRMTRGAFAADSEPQPIAAGCGRRAA